MINDNVVLMDFHVCELTKTLAYFFNSMKPDPKVSSPFQIYLDDGKTFEFVSSTFFYQFFCDQTSDVGVKVRGPNDFVERLPLWKIIERASKYFCDVVSSFHSSPCDSEQMFQHILHLVSFFKMDEEVFLTSIIIFNRYVAATRSFLNISLSNIFYLFILCILLAYKIMLDIPVNVKSVSQALNLNLNTITNNEIQILSALNYDMFYQYRDLDGLEDVFPLEGLMYLSFASRDALVCPKELETILMQEREKIHSSFSSTIYSFHDILNSSRCISPLPSLGDLASNSPSAPHAHSYPNSNSLSPTTTTGGCVDTTADTDGRKVTRSLPPPETTTTPSTTETRTIANVNVNANTNAKSDTYTDTNAEVDTDINANANSPSSVSLNSTDASTYLDCGAMTAEMTCQKVQIGEGMQKEKEREMKNGLEIEENKVGFCIPSVVRGFYDFRLWLNNRDNLGGITNFSNCGGHRVGKNDDSNNPVLVLQYFDDVVRVKQWVVEYETNSLGGGFGGTLRGGYGGDEDGSREKKKENQGNEEEKGTRGMEKDEDEKGMDEWGRHGKGNGSDNGSSNINTVGGVAGSGLAVATSLSVDSSNPQSPTTPVMDLAASVLVPVSVPVAMVMEQGLEQQKRGERLTSSSSSSSLSSSASLSAIFLLS